MKAEVIRWDVGLFGRSVVLAYMDNEIEAVQAFNAYAKSDLKLSLDNAATGWVQDREGDVYVWASSPSTLIHEFVHAAFRLCFLIDAQPDEEIIARLVQYMKLNLLDKIDFG